MTDTAMPADAAGAEAREAERIRMRVHQKAEFYRHLVAFLVTGAVLAGMDVLTSPESLWFYWPMGFWAIGLAMHAADVWMMGDGAGMEERMLRREMERHRHAR
ncbi:MAG TPA: 2TM domain-containing protein [Longimicrobium sp.]